VVNRDRRDDCGAEMLGSYPVATIKRMILRSIGFGAAGLPRARRFLA
jgi:hypothetical protein